MRFWLFSKETTALTEKKHEGSVFTIFSNFKQVYAIGKEKGNIFDVRICSRRVTFQKSIEMFSKFFNLI